MRLYCPILTDSTFPLASICRVIVSGFDNDSGGEGAVTAQVCVSYRWENGSSGECGQEVQNGTASRTGHFEMILEGTALGPWMRSKPDPDYPFLLVTLPGHGPQGFSVLSGYIVTQ